MIAIPRPLLPSFSGSGFRPAFLLVVTVLIAAFACGAPKPLLAQAHDAATLSQSPISAAPISLAQPATSEQIQNNIQPNDALLLDAGDLLDVRVFDTPELSEKLRVNPHGEITLPVGGTVTARGLTSEQLQSAIEQRFRQRNILRDPHVEVFVLEYATQGVTVSGEVKTPGVYPWVGKRSALDFISMAGGLTSSASKTITIVHQNSAGQSININSNNPQQEIDSKRIAILPGDRIVVPRAGVVYVVGDVGRPGGYLIENKDAVTVLQALALAQGMNKTARYDAKLIRDSPAGRTEADVPLKKILANQAPDPALQDGDILFVPVSAGKLWADKGVTSILQMAVGVVIYGRL